MEKKYLTMSDAAEILNVSLSKVKKMCLAGEIPSIKIGKSRRIDPVEFQKYLQSLSGSKEQ